MSEPLRFGLVGCGVIGPIHAEALAALPDALLVAAADLDIERAQRLTAQYGGTPYHDLQSMLRHAGPTCSNAYARMATTDF